MNYCYFWKKYSKDNKLPDDALYLSSYVKDGPLYVGRRGEYDEVGKITTTAGHLNMYYLYTASLGRTTFGEILCGMPGSVYWMRFGRDDTIPKDAIKGGRFWSDCGDLYIGKNNEGEIGKITSCEGKVKLLYCYNSGSTDIGSILCGMPWYAVTFDYHFVPIVEIHGAKAGDIQVKHSLEYGYKGAQLDTETIRNISAQASSNFAAVAPRSMAPYLKEEMEAIKEVYDEMKTSEVTLNVSLREPFYLYQVEVTATMNYGNIIIMKRRALAECDSPVVEKHFRKKNLRPN